MIPPCLNNLKSLRYIDLSHNKFDGSFLISSLANLSNLETIALTCNRNKLKMDTENLDHNPLFQLKVLKLSDCDLKKIPPFLHHQHQLHAVDLSHNQLSGMFPIWLLENNIKITVLNLRNNSFVGELYVPINSTRNFGWIDVSRNYLYGQLQNDFGRILSNMHYVNLSYNHFEGDVPSLGICSTSSNLELSDNQVTGSLPTTKKLDLFDVFDVSNNRMTGEIPSWFADLEHIGVISLRNNSFEGQFPCKETFISVEYLDVSYNSLSGPLPHCFDHTFLKQLNVEGNNFWGSIPSALLKFSELKVLNVRGNRLYGSIPTGIGKLHRLRALLLGNNHLSGLIPKQLCELDYISIMDLSNNNIFGAIPLCFYNIAFGNIKIVGNNLTLAEEVVDRWSPVIEYQYHAQFLHFSIHSDFNHGRFEIDFVTKNRHNSYKGDILNFMTGLDLSCNNLTGKIPLALGNLSSIHALNLSHNRLTGPIPVSFSKLDEIESLDLSYNYLNGEIPSELTNLVRLEVFSVAHNDLSGKIPFMSQFATFDESSYEGNPLLCGLPLNRSCTNSPTGAIVPSGQIEGKWFEVDSFLSPVFFASTSESHIHRLRLRMAMGQDETNFGITVPTPQGIGTEYRIG
ncbi:hypothetical protein PTKIN_Ptkin07bG0022200 [Pterospermum kingtungense]